MEKKFEDLGRYCKKHGFKTKNFIDFLLHQNFLYKSKLNDKTLVSNSKHVKTEQFISIDTNYFYKYINNNEIFNLIVIVERYNLPIYKIPNIQDRKKRFIETAKLTLLFIDFEFVNNQYYEVGFELYKSGKRIQKGYFFEEVAYNQNYIYHNGVYSSLRKIETKKENIKVKNKETKDNKENKDYIKVNVINRNKINIILEELIEKSDYMVVHNCSSELNILKQNGIHIDKDFCICTSYILQNIETFQNKDGCNKIQPSLEDLADLLKVKVDSSKLHFAYYDTEITRKCFFTLVQNFIKELENK